MTSKNEKITIEKTLKLKNLQIYTASLNKIFDSIDDYFLEKKINNQKVEDLIQKSRKNLKKEKLAYINEEQFVLSADQYFPIIQLALLSEDEKIITILLTNIQFLIQNSFIFNISDKLYYIDEVKNINHKRLIDYFIENIVNLNFIKNKEILLIILNNLNEIILNDNILITENSFENIFTFYLKILNSIKDEDIFINTKINLELLTISLFDKIDNSLENEKEKNQFSETIFIEDKDNRKNISKNSNTLSYNKITKFSKKNFLNSFIEKTVNQIIDNICYRHYLHQPETIPLVPSNSKNLSLNIYNQVNSPDIKNEIGLNSGKFGWCFICRKSANFYDIKTRKPICSEKCKKLLTNLEEDLENYLKGKILSKDDIAKINLQNGLNIFRFFCSILTKENYSKELLLLSFDMLLRLLDKYSENILLIIPDFKLIVKGELIEGLYKNSFNDDKQIFIYCIRIFDILINNFRQCLKLQIGVFMEKILIRILESENSSFFEKKNILEYLSKLDSTIYMEIFINYDCDVEEKFLVRGMISVLSKIVQGKFMKNKKLFSKEENFYLRKFSLEIILKLLQEFNLICLKSDKLSSSQLNIVNNQTPKTNYDNQYSETTTDNSYINEFNLFDSENRISDNFDNNVSEDSVQTQKCSELFFLEKDKLNSNLKRKKEIQIAIEKMNIDYKLGIKYLIEHKLIDTTSLENQALNIANLLKNNQTIKKSKIGEIIGDNSELALKILNYYTWSFNFTNKDIVSALREFLENFLLPGEAQKIDRIIQNFSIKYNNDNPTQFNDNNCCYYLSFCIILLQTELHNPNVKEKMTFESFQELLKGKNGEKNLETDFLKDIYMDILNRPLSLPEFEERKEKEEFKNKPDELYKKETYKILNECNLKIKKREYNLNNNFIRISHTEIFEYLPNFIDNIWANLITMHSVIIEDYNESCLVKMCISSISLLIKVLYYCKLDLQKSAVLCSLLSITNLFQNKLMEAKHILCLKEIISLGMNDFNIYQGCFKNSLEIINQIYIYQIYEFGNEKEKENFENFILEKIDNLEGKEGILKIINSNMHYLCKNINSRLIEQLFSKTANLTNENFLNFLEELRFYLKMKFKQKEISRSFWLLKIIEVCEINLFRPKKICQRIFKVISEFLVEISINEEQEFAVTGVDILRQIIIKYLEKDISLENMFQGVLFWPFNLIFKNSKDIYVKEYVIFCITNVTQCYPEKIKNAWITVLQIFKFIPKFNNFSNNFMIESLTSIVRVCEENYQEIEDYIIYFIDMLKSYNTRLPNEIYFIYSFLSNKIMKSEEILLQLVLCLTDLILNENYLIREKYCNILFLCLKVNKCENCEVFWQSFINHTLLSIFKKLEKFKYIDTIKKLYTGLKELSYPSNEIKEYINVELKDLVNKYLE